MTKAISEQPEKPVCAWRTGQKHCRMRPSSRYCAWHSYWFRLVEYGNLARQQHDEFADWWEQFQPYGIYAERPGPWWADRELLWQAIIGEQEPPVKTRQIQSELDVRCNEVFRFRQGLVLAIDPWARLVGLPLPRWVEKEWKQKRHGSFPSTKQCG